jgi:transcriptional antiterminator RfaH
MRDWFVVQLKPHGLKRAEENLMRQGFESFCPKRTETVLRNGSRKQKQAPLFPGYLFVAFDPGSSGWTSLHATRGVARLIVADIRKPTPLPAAFMAGLMARCDDQGLLGAPSDLNQGDRIRVLSGPFADTVASIETLEDHDRIRILMDIMGRQTPILVPTNQIEKLE